MRRLFAILLLLVFLFCAYGALASLEPTEGSPVYTGWLVGYAVVGIISLVASILLLRSGEKDPRP